MIFRSRFSLPEARSPHLHWCKQPKSTLSLLLHLPQPISIFFFLFSALMLSQSRVHSFSLSHSSDLSFLLYIIVLYASRWHEPLDYTIFDIILHFRIYIPGTDFAQVDLINSFSFMVPFYFRRLFIIFFF